MDTKDSITLYKAEIHEKNNTKNVCRFINLCHAVRLSDHSDTS